MQIIRKYYTKLLMLIVAFLCLFTQVHGQFDDEGGPGGFDPPPPNDVPLDTYQWVMMGFALIYGLFVFYKHCKRSKPTQAPLRQISKIASELHS
jgi:hypothetical protein